MNAPVNSQACQINTSYCKFGAETLLNLLDGFKDNIDGVIRNEDIECLHKTRVTSRKLRATLPLFRFCFTEREFKDWIKEIKKVTRLLGEARDLDVQIIFVKDYMEKLSATEKKWMNILFEDHKDQRDRMQSSIDNELEKLKESKILEDILGICQEAIAQQANVTFDPNQVLEKGHLQISFRLDEFLSMEKYVHKENANLRHHEMRISAKKLRYTMEFFAPLYKNHLEEEIRTVKKYQDILGEKHDFEVWIDYIPKFIQKTKGNRKKTDNAKLEIVMKGFLAYIRVQRKDRYTQFADLWDKNNENGFFDKVREITKGRLTMMEQKAEVVLANPNIKVAVLADVHANLIALEKVIQDAKEHGVNVFLNAGDSIGFGPCPNQVLQLLCEKDVFSILGNYDIEVIESKTAAKGEKKIAWKFAKKELSKTCKCYLQSLPRELRLEVAGRKMLVTHGSPESMEEHIYHDTPFERLKVLDDCAKADLIIVGHSHEQFSRTADGACFISPGSVGRPGDGNPQTAYAILSFNPFKVELIRLDYDFESTADALRKNGLPESFAQMMLRGVSLDTITAEDKAKQELMIKNCEEAVEASKNFAEKYWPDIEHILQVTKIASELFDGLMNVHQLGPQERCLLECAAVLHDTGLSKGISGHHKESAKLVLNDTKLPFTSEERRIIASVARYHRKGLPKQKHCNLESLDKASVSKIKILASLLRVADGLDYTHESIVKSINLKVGSRKITAEYVSKKQSVLEEQAFNKKKDLFEKVFGKKLVLVWKNP